RLAMIFALVFCGTPLGAQQSGRAIDWRAVLEWLPADTQTLIVAPQPFAIPRVDEEDEEGDDDLEASPIDMLRLFSTGGLPQFPVLYTPLLGRTVSFAVSGVRRF